MSATPAWISELNAITHNAVASDAATLQAHAAQSVVPAAVCAPQTIEYASAAIRFAGAHNIPLLPRGGGTAQNIGYAPPANALVLSTKNLTAGFAHEPSDIIATIPAGMTLGEAQERMQSQGQWLPLDGPAAATIGGLTATDRSGPLAHGYGTLRDMVIGMTVINGDGEIRKCGGKVVKNVTGYALDKLYIGSLGTLGLITDVTFRLRPLPIGRRTWEVPAANLDAACALLRAIARKNLPLESLRALHSRNKPPRIVAAAAGTAAELDRIHAEISATAAPQQPQSSTASLQWTAASAHSSGQHEKPKDAGATLRFWCRATTLDKVLPLLEPLADCMEFHTQGGSAALKCSTQQAVDLAAKLTATNANLRFDNVRELDIRDRFGPPRPDWQIMQQIHTALDPKAIMNPGRFVV